ncbi:MAG TPA: hypothetical protein VN326_23235 [Casimicrobiaceae bacterium]|nr:hypothetical protein [Casimicrobiaceae bacterium]
MTRALTRANGISFAFKVRLGCVIAVVAACYATGFGGFWLGDDFANITSFYNRELEGHLWPDMLAYFATGLSSVGSMYRPFSMLNLAANYAAAGVDYAGWYLTSFTVHLANVALVALVVHRLALLCKSDGSWSAPLAALLFGLAPTLAEGVYWQSARADAWVTLLSLLAVRAWIGSGRSAWLSLPPLTVALAFKESAALLPLQLALLAYALPGKRLRAQWASLLLAFALLAAYLGWRAYLFGHVWGVYRAPSAANQARNWSGFLGAFTSVAPWWTELMAGSSTAAAAYLCALGAVLAISLAAVTDSRERAGTALALLLASGGMAFATVLNLGGLPASGEGGRLTYGPLAWLALAIGVSCARARAGTGTAWAARIRVVSLAAIVVACGVSAWTLTNIMGLARGAQDSMRLLARGLPEWADTHDGLTLLIVPERIGPVAFGRNGQGGLAMPPFQSRPLLHRVLPTLPAEIPTRFGQLAGGLATRLAEESPSRISADTLPRLLQPATARWPEHYACWSLQRQQALEMTLPQPVSEHAWSGDLLEAVRMTCGTMS